MGRKKPWHDINDPEVDRLVLGWKLGAGSTIRETSVILLSSIYPVPILGAGVNLAFRIISFNLGNFFHPMSTSKVGFRHLPGHWPLANL